MFLKFSLVVIRELWWRYEKDRRMLKVSVVKFYESQKKDIEVCLKLILFHPKFYSCEDLVDGIWNVGKFWIFKSLKLALMRWDILNSLNFLSMFKKTLSVVCFISTIWIKFKFINLANLMNGWNVEIYLQWMKDRNDRAKRYRHERSKNLFTFLVR